MIDFDGIIGMINKTADAMEKVSVTGIESDYGQGYSKCSKDNAKQVRDLAKHIQRQIDSDEKSRSG